MTTTTADFTYRPSSWTTLAVYLGMMRSLNGLGVEAVIAGGAIRDIFLGQQPKDIDIFLWAGEQPTIRAMFPGIRNTIAESVADYLGEQFDCAEVLTLPMGISAPWQFVFLRRPTHEVDLTTWAVQRIDFGLCRAAVNEHGWIFSKEFEQDIQNRTATFMLTDASEARKDRSRARFERFKERYPDLTLVGL